MRPFMPIPVLATLILALPVSQAEEQPSSGSLWVPRIGLEFDDAGGNSFFGGLSWLPGERTFVGLDFSLSDSSAGLSGLESRLVSGTLDHSFGLVGASLSAGWAGYSGEVDRVHFGGSLYLRTHGLRLGIVAESWNSDFDPVEFTRVIERPPPLPPLRVTGRADCNLDNIALGLRTSWSSERWSLYASATDYDYSDADCAFSGSIGGHPFRLSPDALARDAPRLLRRLDDIATDRIFSSWAMFYDRAYSAGLAYSPGLWTLSADYFHSKEVFQGLRTDSVTASVLFPLGWRTDLELHAGVSDYEAAGTVAFGGLSLYWYLGGD